MAWPVAFNVLKTSDPLERSLVVCHKNISYTIHRKAVRMTLVVGYSSQETKRLKDTTIIT